jgi:hypothetical protein
MRQLARCWHTTTATLTALGIQTVAAKANSYDQVALHSGASSGPVWSGTENLQGTGNFIFHMGSLTITCSTSTGQGTVNSADVGNLTSFVYQGTGVVGCPGNLGNWTIQPKLPWSIHQLYDQTTNQFITIFDNFNLTFNGPVVCKFAGGISLFSDIAQPSTIYGSQTNPTGGNPGKVVLDQPEAPLVRSSGGALCPATNAFTGAYNEQGLRGTTLFNIWQRNQGARVQG